ncbi:hypothetical protein [Dyadobacter sediminis]|uniref:Uncharacterized protein n=1 Tax=Dyadobacter sediminis TaxID=1493691 RepID=A0A5R9KJ83_9BACT|nr:hypothetical protein [Dyadobacter sediminis]TLU96283.1 hypothetical protein FEM55_03850 [Dyadobacter sediminis]GGB80885.1 hypothetical protein GCM10011325_05490 [Dyadobacter sediminis]
MRFIIRLYLALWLSAILPPNAFSQISTGSVAGEYHLQDVMETSSAILLKPDSTFELFFSYGSVDRKGTGKWQVDDGKIILNSSPKPKADLKLVTSKAKSGEHTTVRIRHPDKQILPYFEVLAKSPDGDQFGKTDAKGYVKLPKVKAGNLEVFFSFTPERFSAFQVNPEDNYFEFQVEPWIMELFVKDMSLTVHENGLLGGHPLIRGNSLFYRKVN